MRTSVHSSATSIYTWRILTAMPPSTAIVLAMMGTINQPNHSIFNWNRILKLIVSVLCSWIISEPTKDTRYFLFHLKPYTQYAFYVKTMTISTERRNGQSVIHYFKTKSDVPESVNNLQAYAESSSVIVMNWLPPTLANGNLIKYKVKAVLVTKNAESRNYCKDRMYIY